MSDSWVSRFKQVQNIYSRGNAIIRNFTHCAESIKCLLFNSYCSNIYCAPLWTRYTGESFRRIKVAYNRIFRVLFGLWHRISVSTALVQRVLNPFNVLFRKCIVSFRSRLLSSSNTLIKTIMDILYLCIVHSWWNGARWFSVYKLLVAIHYWYIYIMTYCGDTESIYIVNM